MRIRLSIGACFVAVFLAVSASGHDPPFEGNRAAEEAMLIERAIRAPNSNPKARAKLFSVMAWDLRWHRSQLDVCFWNGDAALRARVAKVADELVADLPVKFAWHGLAGCPQPLALGGPWQTFPIRVSLERAPALVGDGDDPGSFFALIGRESSYDRRATVNLPFGEAPNDTELRFRVLHEFCHALGCLHEHQRAGCAEFFDPANIKSHYGLSDDQYRRNFEAIPNGGIFGTVVSGTPDPDSVMLYAFRKAMFRAGSQPFCLRDRPATVLSALDAAGLARAYTSRENPGSLSIGDFAPLAAEKRAQARLMKSQLALFRGVLKGLPVTESDEQPLLLALRSLEEGSKAVEAEADSYTLAPEDAAAAEAALKLLMPRASPPN